MKTFIRAISPCAGVVVAASFLVCMPALAQSAEGGEAKAAPAEPAAEAKPDFTYTANVAVASQYISRGFRQTWGKPALQGGFDVAHSSGLFAGTWMSTVSNRYIEDGSLEWDLYVGYAATAGDFGYGVTYYQYIYPGARIGFANTSYNYAEIVPMVSWKFLSAKYWYTVSRDYFGYNDKSLGTTASTGDRHSRGSGYLDLNANIPVGESGYTVLLHYGAERVKNFGFTNWTDGKIGLSKTFDGGWTATGAYTRAWFKDGFYTNYYNGEVDANGNPLAVSHPGAGTFAVMLSRVF